MVNYLRQIPKEWSLLEFNKIATLRKTKYIPNPFEHLKCLELEHFEKETGSLNGYIDSAQQSSTKNVFKAGDVLFGKLRPYLKKFNRPNFDGVCSTEIWVLNGLDTCKNSYLYLLIQTNKFNNICNVSTGTHMPRADWNFVENIPFFLPPLPEQEKIAGILETWDKAIEKLSDLIEQKKLLKKGLMQKLLTGKTRLNGFTQPWKEVKLGEIFNIKKGQGLSKDVLDSKGVYKCILYGELYTKYSEVIKNTISRTNKNEKITSNIGDILIPASTTTSGIDLANATALFESDVILGGDINILRTKKEISPVFFAYLLTHSYKFDIARLAQGITIVHLYAEFLKSMKVFVPIDTNEQKAIADVLSTADDEINLLNQKLEALKEQKKGLMQQLLTGQIRVKVN